MSVEVFVATLVFVVLLIFWGWMFRDFINNEYIEGNARFIWLAAFLVTFVFGAGLYYFLEYRPRHL